MVKKNVKRTRKYKKRLRLHSVYDGGSAFVKGGFGCIFKPSLQCKENSIPVRKNYVSKLIKTKYGKREYDYVYNIKKKISHLPESIKKYFLLDSITICTPGQLSMDDKKNIEDVCDNILSEVSDGASDGHVNSKNINNNLDKFKIINMPELSISLTNYIKKTKITPIEIIRINNIIIEYISKVIPELYKNGVIHGDIKADNLMFDHFDGNLLLIDWGLSYLQNENKKDIPEALYMLSTQWHHPFSSLLFKRNRINDCNVFLETLKNEGSKVTRENVRGFITSEYKKISVIEKKQLNVLNDTLMYAYHNEIKKTTKHHSEKDIKKIINDRVIRLIVEYNTDIFMRFIKDYKLYLDKYCNEVYIMNVDIWGVMSIYVDIIEKLSPLYNNNVKSEFKTTTTKIMDKLINIHVENLYKNGDKVINIPKLVSDIKELNEYLVSIDHGFNKTISIDSKISIQDVNKIHQKTKFSENISILNKLEKYSSTRFNSSKYKKKILLYSPVDVVRGGKKTRKNRKDTHVS